MLTLDFKVIAHKVSLDENKGAYTVTLRCAKAMPCMDDIAVYVDSLDCLPLGSLLRASFYDELKPEGQ